MTQSKDKPKLSLLFQQIQGRPVVSPPIPRPLSEVCDELSSVVRGMQETAVRIKNEDPKPIVKKAF